VSGFGDLSNVPLICGSSFSGLTAVVAPVVRLRSESEPQQWAAQILALLRNFDEDVLKTELQPVLDLATEYLNHLLIASMSLHLFLNLRLILVAIARNPGGKKTPQETAHPTPDITRLQTIQELLNEATIGRKQSALKTLVSEFA